MTEHQLTLCLQTKSSFHVFFIFMTTIGHTTNDLSLVFSFFLSF